MGQRDWAADTVARAEDSHASQAISCHGPRQDDRRVDDLSPSENRGKKGWYSSAFILKQRLDSSSLSVVGWTEIEADVQLVALEKHVRRGKDKALPLSQLQISYRRTDRSDRHGQVSQSLLRY